MTKVPNGVEILPKITIAWVGSTSVTDRQTTDGQATAYSEHEREFTIAKKATTFCRCQCRHWRAIWSGIPSTANWLTWLTCLQEQTKTKNLWQFTKELTMKCQTIKVENTFFVLQYIFFVFDYLSQGCFCSSHCIISSVVTTIEISPPPRWLATTEPTPPPRCFTVFSAVFLGTVYCASLFRSAAIVI